MPVSHVAMSASVQVPVSVVAIGCHHAGVKGHVHHVFLGHRVKVVGDLDIHGGAVHGHRGLGRGGGGEPLAAIFWYTSATVRP